MTNLVALGWNTYFEELYTQKKTSDLIPARVIREDRDAYIVQTAKSTIYAEMSGKLLYSIESSNKPKVGDWVIGLQADNDLFIIQEKVI